MSERILSGAPFLSATDNDSLILCRLSRLAFASAERSRKASSLKPPFAVASALKLTDSSSSIPFGVKTMSLSLP